MSIVKTGKKSKKVNAVVEEMRREIVSGRLAPGSRLPTQEELKQRYDISNVTIQRVFNMLVSDGFIDARGSAGTFVASDPPHLSSYGVVFFDRPLARPNDGTFFSHLAYHCLELQQSGQRNIQLYFEVTGHLDDPDYSRLLADLHAHRLAGLLITHGSLLRVLPADILATYPTVTLGYAGYDLPIINTNPWAFTNKALDYLAQQGRRQIAVIGSLSDVNDTYLATALQQRGLTSKPIWQTPVYSNAPAANQQVTRQLLYYMMDRPERPDGIIITDDVFTDQALAGLLDAGIRIGEEVDVVAHCNHPLLAADLWPIKRLGTDTRQFLTTALELIDINAAVRRLLQ